MGAKLYRMLQPAICAASAHSCTAKYRNIKAQELEAVHKQTVPQYHVYKDCMLLFGTDVPTVVQSKSVVRLHVQVFFSLLVI